MELRVLRYFLAIAKEESVSGAAKVLNITQPTLSKQLMDLEEKLNTKLFLRENRKMKFYAPIEPSVVACPPAVGKLMLCASLEKLP